MSDNFAQALVLGSTPNAPRLMTPKTRQSDRRKRLVLVVSSAAAVALPHLIVAQVHPVASRIVRPIPVSAKVAVTTETPTAVPELFAHAKRIATISGAGVNAERFGRIDRAAIDRAGYVYLVDGELNQVLLLTRTGKLVQRLSYTQRERAPFRSPASVVVDRNDEIVIGDKASKLHRYHRSGDSLTFATSERLSVSPFDLCISGDQTVVQGATLESPDLVRVFARGGNQVGTFGSVYKTDNQILAYTFGRARIACDASVVLLAPEASIPDVRAYSRNGAARWITELSGYIPVPATEGSHQSVAVELPKRGYHRVHSVMLLSKTTALVQIDFVVPPATGIGDEVQVTSILINVANGHSENIGTVLPPIAAFNVETGRYVVVRQKPSPEIEIWQAAKFLP